MCLRFSRCAGGPSVHFEGASLLLLVLRVPTGCSVCLPSCVHNPFPLADCAVAGRLYRVMVSGAAVGVPHCLSGPRGIQRKWRCCGLPANGENVLAFVCGSPLQRASCPLGVLTWPCGHATVIACSTHAGDAWFACCLQPGVPAVCVNALQFFFAARRIQGRNTPTEQDRALCQWWLWCRV